MPVSEKQKGYARKWDKDNMRTLGTRVRTQDAEDFKALDIPAYKFLKDD